MIRCAPAPMIAPSSQFRRIQRRSNASTGVYALTPSKRRQLTAGLTPPKHLFASRPKKTGELGIHRRDPHATVPRSPAQQPRLGSSGEACTWFSSQWRCASVNRVRLLAMEVSTGFTDKLKASRLRLHPARSRRHQKTLRASNHPSARIAIAIVAPDRPAVRQSDCGRRSPAPQIPGPKHVIRRSPAQPG